MKSNRTHSILHQASAVWQQLGFASKHTISTVFVALTGAITYYSALTIGPFDRDNLLALSVGAKGHPLRLFTGSFVSYLPGYRPIPYLTLWAQYNLFGINLRWYFLTNIVIWIICVAIVYRLAYHLIYVRTIALIVAMLLLLDPRALPAIYWIGERQSTLACLFGTAAILFSVRTRFQHRAASFATIYALLLLAALSKEFGLAFIIATGLVCLSRREHTTMLLTVAVATASTYLLLRLVVANGASVPNYCETLGFFRHERVVCVGELPLTHRAAQYTYNIGATLVGTLFPPVFTSSGALQSFRSIFADVRLLGQLVLTLPVVMGAVVAGCKRRELAVPFLALIISNSILSFPLYRGRNQLVGVIGLYIVAAIGWSSMGKPLPAHPRWKMQVLAIPMLVFGFFAISRTMTVALHRQIQSQDRNPCETAQLDPVNISMDLTRILVTKYGLADCAAEPSTIVNSD